MSRVPITRATSKRRCKIRFTGELWAYCKLIDGEYKEIIRLENPESIRPMNVEIIGY